LNTNTSGFSIYTDYYGETFAESFDNDLMPYFSVILFLIYSILVKMPYFDFSFSKKIQIESLSFVYGVCLQPLYLIAFICHLESLFFV